MPTYDYVCNACGHRFDAFQRITAQPLQQCPKCQGPVQRLVGGGLGLIFKGSGFYITDYKMSGQSKSESSGDKKAA